MFGKWVATAFVGLSALAATNVHASSSFESLLSSPYMTPTMQTHLESLRKRLGANIDLDEWVLKEHTNELETALGNLDSNEFATTFARLGKFCGIPTSKLSIRTSLMVTSAGLTIDVSDRDIVAHLQNIPKECADVSTSVAQINEAIAPRKFEVDKERLISGVVLGNTVAPWVEVSQSGQLKSVLDVYARECRVKVNSVKLDTFDGYDRPSMRKAFELTAHPAIGMKRLEGIIARCKAVFPNLAAFNENTAMKHGLIFSVELDSLANQRITPKQIDDWTKFFKNDTQNLDDLKARVLHDSRKFDFRSLRDCVIKHSLEECNNPLMGIELSTFNHIESVNAATALFLIVLGDPLLFTTTVGRDVVVEGKAINLDVTVPPRIPAKF